MHGSAAGAGLELPASLVEELLEKNARAGGVLADSIRAVQSGRPRIRKWMERTGRIRRDADLPGVAVPTACGIDGSCVVERMLSTSIVACAAVRVEGFTPPSEARPAPADHESIVEIETHEPEVGQIARGLMKMLETRLASGAPHDVVLVDGSVTSQVIHMNQAMSAAYANPRTRAVGTMIIDGYEEFLEQFAAMLENATGGRVWASLPKFTTRSELGELFGLDHGEGGWPGDQDDRSVMTAVLRPGEYTAPEFITRTGKRPARAGAAGAAPGPPKRRPDNWHLVGEGAGVRAAAGRATNFMREQVVFYYRPASYAPAMRIEVAGRVVWDRAMAAALMKALKYQYASYAVMEPYPLFMADRMAKSLGAAVPALVQSALQDMAEKPDIGTESMLFGMRSYRTEVGM